MKSKDRVSLLQIFQFVAVGLSLVWPALVSAQTVVATIPLGATRPAVAVNPLTNKIYVASCTRYGLGGTPAGSTGKHDFVVRGDVRELPLRGSP